MRRQFHFLGELTDEGFIAPRPRRGPRRRCSIWRARCYQLGGVVTISAVDEQIGPDTYVTTGVLIAYDSSRRRSRRREPRDRARGRS